MIAVVVTNLLYLGGALVVAVVIALVVVARQRKPKSVEANVDSFHKGLRALAPDDVADRPASRPSWGGAHKPVLVRPGRPPASDDAEEAGSADADAAGDEAQAEDGEELDSTVTGSTDDAPVDLASRQRRDTGGTAAKEAPSTSEETGTG